MNGWIGVVLEGTLAEYTGWMGIEHIGPPIPEMVERVRGWIADGREVRIVTARVSQNGTTEQLAEANVARAAIKMWCKEHLGSELLVVNFKDWAMVELWDDRAVQVLANTGAPLHDLMTEYVRRQREWSIRTFGPGRRTLGITDHIRKELAEVEAKPEDLEEWIDVMILAIDGYQRAGGFPEYLMERLYAKQRKNFARKWPTPTSEDVATEHDRSEEVSAK